MNISRIFVGTAAAIALASPAAYAQATAPSHDRPAAAQQTAKDQHGTNEVEDAWILTKVKTKFVGEDALEGSDINVDVENGVVTLKGTVASEAGRARAITIAKDTDGVSRVDDRLVIGMAKAGDDHDMVGTSGTTAAAKADEAADKAADATEHAADKTGDAMEHAGEESKDAVGTAGEAVSDGWITTKVTSSFIGVDALDGSDIDVDTNDHVVTLRGTVPNAAARAEAMRITRTVKGVTRVDDQLTIGDKH